MINIGLNSHEIDEIKDKLSNFKNIEKIVLFGSRAKGNYKKGSDIDLALFFKTNTDDTWKVSDKLNNETSLPYIFDIKNYDNISNVELKKHIDRVGIVLY